MSVMQPLSEKIDFLLFAQKNRVRRTVLVTITLLSLAAYLTNADLFLFVLAVGSPILFMLSQSNQDNAKKRRNANGGLCDEETLVRLLDQELLEDAGGVKTACITLSVDAFEDVEKKWDKAACDHALFETASRINSALRSGDVLAQLGKARYGIFVSEVRAPETSAVLTLCERIEAATSAPIQIDEALLHVTVSAGFCIDARAPQRTGVAMLSAANAALEEAKQNAPRAIRSFSHKTAKPIDSAFADSVLDAMREGQIVPWFQPQISTDTGEITGVEALARWDHPEKGVLPTSDFLPALEAAGRLEELGETILNHALRALVEWDQAGVFIPSVAVNFATQELRNPSLVERIKWDVDRFELDPTRLTVEILETVISERDDDIITRNIRALGTQGFRIDLDDFGTGHASLSNIRRFAVDRIKIDRSFVADADSDPEQQRMIAAIVGLGERLGIETLAEGVENMGEQSILSQLGCNHLQGFAIARPMPFEKTIDWIQNHQKSLAPSPILGKRNG